MSGSPDAARGPLHPEPAGRDTNARPSVGDRVRVVIEGEVAQARRFSLSLGTVGGLLWDMPTDGFGDITVSVEVLPPPEPAWWPPEVGDVIEIHESAYLRRPQRWINGNGATYTDDEILERVSGVTLLVRDGKPVA